MTNKLFTYISTATLLALLILGPASADRTYGPIQSRDYLGTIVKKAYPKSKLKPQQMMVAILRANPDAFKGHNIHFIKAGFTLNLPSNEVIKTIDNNEAIAIIKKHYESFKRGKTGNFTLKALPTIKAETVENKQEQKPTQNDVNNTLIENKPDAEEPTESEPANKNEPAKMTIAETAPHSGKAEKATATANPESKLAISDEKNLADKKTNHSYDKLGSLENIRSQQNKTIDLLDQQIAEIENLIDQDDQQEKETKQLKSQSNIESEKSTYDSIKPTSEALNEDVIIEDSAINPDTEAPKDDAENITEAQQSNSNETALQDTDNLSQPWQLAILLGVLSLLGLIAYRAFRKPAMIKPRKYSTATATNNPESLRDTTSGLAVETHTDDDLLSPVIKTAQKPIADSMLSAQTAEETTQIHEDTELKINMAKAYIDMGYIDAATEVLEEASQESSQQQQDIIDKLIKNI